MRQSSYTQAPLFLLCMLAASSPLAASPPQTQQSAAAVTKVPSGDKLQVRTNIKVVYGISADKARMGVGEGLFFAQRLLDNYDQAKLPSAQRALVIVLYDQAAYWLLNERAWSKLGPGQALSSANHPNAKLSADLIARGARVEVCANTLKKKGWSADDLLPGVHVVPGALARIVDLQLSGFAHINFD